MQIKITLFKSRIQSAICSGLEAAALSESQWKQLEAIQMRFLSTGKVRIEQADVVKSVVLS